MKIIKEITDKDILGTDGYSNAKPRMTARAILKNINNEYAVIHSKEFDLYSFPGGGIEDDENIINALKREITEETGCECSLIKDLGIIKENRAYCNYTQISYYFIVTTNDTMLNPAFTKAEKKHKTTVDWHTLDEVKKLITESIYDTEQKKFLQARDAAALNEYLLSYGKDM